jgi:hypothetical protein
MSVGGDQQLKVFISYSRRDSSDFADELREGLELAGSRRSSTVTTLPLARTGKLASGVS